RSRRCRRATRGRAVRKAEALVKAENLLTSSCGAVPQVRASFVAKLDLVVTTVRAAAFRGSGKTSRRTPKLRAGLEGNVHGLAIFCGERDLLILCAQLLVHEGDRVIAR